MTIYSNTDILDAIASKTIKIRPYCYLQLQTNSYDLCLGNTFYEVFWDTKGPFYIGPYVYQIGDKVSIPIAGTLLGVTMERVGTFGKVVADLRSRSSTRRKGITTNCDAGLGDVGYDDVWTMEFTAFVRSNILHKFIEKFIYFLDNLPSVIALAGYTRQMLAEYLENKWPLPFLIVGEPVAQMVFFECKSEPTKEYDGQYQVEWPLNMIPREYRHQVIAPK